MENEYIYTFIYRLKYIYCYVDRKSNFPISNINQFDMNYIPITEHMHLFIM